MAEKVVHSGLKMALLSPRVARLTPCRATANFRRAVAPRVVDLHATPKEELLDLCGHVPNNGVTAPDELRRRIRETVEALERLNTVEKPAGEDAVRGVLDGTWALEYTTTKAASSGKLGPFVGEVTQVVDVGNEYYVNNVTFGPLKISLTADWSVLSDVKWRVSFKEMYVTLFGTELYRKPFPPEVGGYWKMTYVDENLRLVRTITDRREASNAPIGSEIQDVLEHIEENLFVLTRIPG
ncbi:hypothetical protein BSKO_02161 [Bryopsis sp. KO-2023]|nr:hypothetical protein BSKO_02161 [Bryopsis sp. KO-2023]